MSDVKWNCINVLDSNCPSRRTLALLADKWTLLVIIALKTGKMRNGELKRRLGDVSQKMLTQTLRRLESCGIVERIIYHTVPPHVEYQLTPLGYTLKQPLEALRDWAEQYYNDVELAQKTSGGLLALNDNTDPDIIDD